MRIVYDALSDMEQGSIYESGTYKGENEASDTQCRCSGRYDVPQDAGSMRMAISATSTTGKSLSVRVFFYKNGNNSYIGTYAEVPIDGCKYNYQNFRGASASYDKVRFKMKYTDGSALHPDEIESIVITFESYWWASEGSLGNDLMAASVPQILDTELAGNLPLLSWAQKEANSSPSIVTDILDTVDTKFSRTFPFGYWRIDDGNNGETYTELFLGIPRIPHEPPSPDPPAPEYEEAIIMQYDIYCDGQLMHSSVTPEMAWKVIDPVLDLQDSAAGSLEFTLPPFNCMYGKCQMMMSTISVRRNGVEIWEGRPVSFKEDMWLNHPITCEGELAYLNDIYQPQYKYENVTFQQLINGLLLKYNERAAADRQFSIGVCETPDIQSDMIEVIIPYESTLQAINDLCKTYNMHVYMANEWHNGVKTRKISFYRDGGQLLGNNVTQKIELGRNLVDYAKSYNFSSLVTAVLPLGAKSSKAGATIKDDDSEFDILSTSIVQGSIKSDGTDKDADNRVRTGFINITSGADTLVINATGNNVPPGQTLQVNLELYSGNTVDTFVREYSESSTIWFDMPKTINVATYGATHARLVFRFSGDNDILPDYITSGTISVSKTRHGEPYAVSSDSSQRHGRGYVIWPTNGYDKRDEEYRQYHYAGDIVDITNIPDFDTNETGFSRNRYFVYKYTITEKNATVFIDTQMKMGAGIVVVYNNNSRYFIKKSNKNGTTAWDDMKFSGWYEGFTGDVTMYVACYDTMYTSGVPNGLTVYNSKIVDSGLEEYVTVQNQDGSSSVSGEGISENIDGLYVIDKTGAPVGERPIDIYGRIERKVDWSDVKDSWTLYQNAITYLRSDQFDGLQIDLTAMDMSMLGFDATQLRVGEKVNVVAPIYGLNTEMPVSAIKIPLNKPEDAIYTVGSKNKQTLTAVNSSTNTELLSLIAAKPDMSTVLKTAKKSAAEYLLDTQNGYVTMRYGENGHPEAIIISDNEDYTMSSAGYWIFGKHGIGFVKAGDDEAEAYNEATVAMTYDGNIVADYITTGTMSADRIFGDTLKLGLLGTESGNMKVYDGSLSNQVAQIDKDGIKQWSGDYWVRINDGCVRFGDDRQSETNGIFIKGNGSVDGADQAIEIYADANTSGTTMLGIATDRIGIWIPGSGSGGSDAYGFGVDTTVQVRNKDLSFHMGILTDVDDHSGGGLPSGQFTIGDTTYHFTDGLIDRVTVNPNNS